MPRLAREIEPGVVYHLISRFVDREWYIESEEERDCYLRMLAHALSESDWRCLSYAVMSNHIHFGMIAGDHSLASWIRRVHSPFADWMNRTHDRIGGIFVRGPKAKPVALHRVGSLIAYIHNNPVRAGVVDDPSASTWTSHRAYLGRASRPAWLHVEEGLHLSGFAGAPLAFDDWTKDPTRDPLEHEGEFLHELTQTPPRKPTPEAIVDATAHELGVSARHLLSGRKGPVETLGRQVAVQCAFTLGLNGVEIAKTVGCSQQRASAIRRETTHSDLVRRVLQRLQGQSTTYYFLSDIRTNAPSADAGIVRGR